jgi:hypothetical protein
VETSREQLEASELRAPWTCPSWRALGVESHEFDLRSLTFRSEGPGDLVLELKLADPWNVDWAVTFENVRHVWIQAGLRMPEEIAEGVYTEMHEIGSTSRQDDVFELGLGSGMVAFKADQSWVERA